MPTSITECPHTLSGGTLERAILYQGYAINMVVSYVINKVVA
jgi:hypothetical protein